MRIVWLATVLVVLAGCSSMDYMAYRDEPEAFGNPALLNCAAKEVPVCQIEGGRTRQRYSNCACR